MTDRIRWAVQRLIDRPCARCMHGGRRACCARAPGRRRPPWRRMEDAGKLEATAQFPAESSSDEDDGSKLQRFSTARTDFSSSGSTEEHEQLRRFSTARTDFNPGTISDGDSDLQLELRTPTPGGNKGRRQDLAEEAIHQDMETRQCGSASPRKHHGRTRSPTHVSHPILQLKVPAGSRRASEQKPKPSGHPAAGASSGSIPPTDPLPVVAEGLPPPGTSYINIELIGAIAAKEKALEAENDKLRREVEDLKRALGEVENERDRAREALRPAEEERDAAVKASVEAAVSQLAQKKRWASAIHEMRSSVEDLKRAASMAQTESDTLNRAKQDCDTSMEAAVEEGLASAYVARDKAVKQRDVAMVEARTLRQILQRVEENTGRSIDSIILARVPRGIVHDFDTTGWVMVYDELYDDDIALKLNDIMIQCEDAPMVLIGARKAPKGSRGLGPGLLDASPTLSLCSAAPFEEVFRETKLNMPHRWPLDPEVAGAFWYCKPPFSMGFAPCSDINQNQPGDTRCVGGEKRLSWQLDGGGGFRAGNVFAVLGGNRVINEEFPQDDLTLRKVVMCLPSAGDV
eukprot:COSAG05_NODE_479_length_9424_cov_38.098552_7_plen_574_part_00